MKLSSLRFGLLLAAILCIWFWPSIFGGKVLLPLDLLWQHPPHEPPEGVEGIHNPLLGDMLYENYFWQTFYRRSILSGEAPFWNPGTYCGHPFYATGLGSVFYPFSLLFLIVPVTYASVIYTGMHLWLGGMFLYWFCRRIGVGAFGSAVGGVISASCGFLAMRLLWPPLLGSAIWLPLMLLCVHWMSDSGNVRQACGRVAASAVVFALPVLGGFFEIAMYTYIVAALFAAARMLHVLISARSWRRTAGLAGQFAAVVGLASMLAAPQILPFLVVKDLNIRRGQIGYQDVVHRALKAGNLLPMLMPDIFGNPSEHMTWDLQRRRFVPIETRVGTDHYHFGTRNYSENGYYLGLLPLLLMLLPMTGRGQHRWFFYGLLALSVPLAFGAPLYRVLYALVPGFDQVRTPFRWMFPATFAIAVLAGIGAHAWHARLGREEESERRPATWSRASGILLVAISLLMVGLTLILLAYPDPAIRWAERFRASSVLLSSGGAPPDAPALAGHLWGSAMRFTLFLAVAVTLIALPLLRRMDRRGSGVASLMLLAWVAADAGLANATFMTHSDPAWLEREPASVTFLKQDEDVFRVARFGQDIVLHPNLAALEGLHDVGGYDSVIPRDFATYLNAIEPQRTLWWNQIRGFVQDTSIDSALFKLLNVRYLLTSPDEWIDHPDWELVHEGNMCVYRCRDEWSRVFMVHEAQGVESLDEALYLLAEDKVDPRKVALVEGQAVSLDAASDGNDHRGRVEIREYRNNRVDLDTVSDAQGVVVLTDFMYPGWQAYVDDLPAKILRVDGIFRGVVVPAGQHIVSFRFEPPHAVGWGLCGAAILLMGVGGVLSGQRRGAPKEHGHDHATPAGL